MRGRKGGRKEGVVVQEEMKLLIFQILEAVQTEQSVFFVFADCSGTAGHAAPAASRSQPTKW